MEAVMRVVRMARSGRKASAEGIFVGNVELQSVITEGKDLRLVEVHFKDGARNKWHTHTTDQILVITEGEGIVASGNEERKVSTGDVAFIPEGERHWHGAQPGKDMTHLAMNGGSSKTTIAGA
ncbi:MAG: cupin domain-containing protein [Actinobacteria bacterium]|nr:cupin domain-containing protein [Actinomycetota bacterium]